MQQLNLTAGRMVLRSQDKSKQTGNVVALVQGGYPDLEPLLCKYGVKHCSGGWEL